METSKTKKVILLFAFGGASLVFMHLACKEYKDGSLTFLFCLLHSLMHFKLFYDVLSGRFGKRVEQKPEEKDSEEDVEDDIEKKE